MAYPNYIKDAAREQFLRGMKPPSIARELDAMFPEEDPLPGEKTIRNWSKAWGLDQSGKWSMTRVGDAEILLPLLRDLIEGTGGKVSSFTNAEAEELSRLGSAAEGMPAVARRNWAAAMVEARATGEPLDPLITYMAFRPWEDEGRCYLSARDAGWIKEVRRISPSDGSWFTVGAHIKRE